MPRSSRRVAPTASLQYRLWPRELSGGVPGFLYGVVETNLIYQGKNEINGAPKHAFDVRFFPTR